MEAELDEHIKASTMFQHAVKYSVQMTNILLKLFNLEIKTSRLQRRRIDLFKIYREL
jgi:hypothetical protein